MPAAVELIPADVPDALQGGGVFEVEELIVHADRSDVVSSVVVVPVGPGVVRWLVVLDQHDHRLSVPNEFLQLRHPHPLPVLKQQLLLQSPLRHDLLEPRLQHHWACPRVGDRPCFLGDFGLADGESEVAEDSLEGGGAAGVGSGLEDVGHVDQRNGALGSDDGGGGGGAGDVGLLELGQGGRNHSLPLGREHQYGNCQPQSDHKL